MGREVNQDRIRKPAFGSAQSALNERTTLMVGLAAFICGAQSVVLTPVTFEYFSGMGESPVSRILERVIFKLGLVSLAWLRVIDIFKFW